MTASPHSRHARRREQTRRRLIEAAIDLVLAKGYDSITIQEITDRADLGYGTFYLHFKDKEDIVGSAVEEGVKATQGRVSQQFARIIPPQIEYYGYLNIFEHVAANRDLYKVMLGSKASPMLTHRIQELLAADIVQHLQSRSADFLSDFDLPAEVTAQILTGAISRTALWWIEAPNPYTVEEMAGMLYRALHHKDPPAAVKERG